MSVWYLFTALLLALSALAWLGVAARWVRAGLAEHLALALCGVLLQVVMETQALAVFWSAYTFGASLALNLIVTGVLLGTHWYPLGECLRELRGRLSGLPRTLRRQPLAVVGVLGGVVLSALVLAFTFEAPIPGYDATHYHLPMATLLIQEQGFSGHEIRMLHALEFPRNAQMLFARIFLFAGDETLIRFVPWLAALGTVLALYGWMRRWGADTETSAALAMSFLCLPVVMIQQMTTWGTVDLVFAFLMIVALGMACGDGGPQDRSRAIACLVVAALAVGTRGQGLMLGGALMAFVIVREACALPRGKAAMRALALAAVALVLTILLGSLSYVQNYQRFGNPVAPVALSIAGKEVFPGRIPAVDDLIGTEASTGSSSRLGAIAAAWKPVWTRDWIYSGETWRLGQWGPYWLAGLLPGALAGLAVLAVRRRWWEAGLAALFLLLFVVLPGGWWARFSIWLMGLCVLLLGTALGAIPRKYPRRGAVLLALALAAVGAAEVHRTVRHFELRRHEYPDLPRPRWSYETFRRFERGDLSDRALYRWIAENLPEGAQLLYFWSRDYGIMHYHLHRPDLRNTVRGIDNPHTPEQMATHMARHQPTHIVVRSDERAAQWAGEYGERVFESGEMQVFQIRE